MPTVFGLFTQIVALLSGVQCILIKNTEIKGAFSQEESFFSNDASSLILHKHLLHTRIFTDTYTVNAKG